MADVDRFLREIGMMRYSGMFHAKGFDLDLDVSHLTDHDLQHSLNVTDTAHRTLILRHAAKYKPAWCLESWLQANHLSHYHEGFLLCELTTREQLASIQLTDEIMMELEVELPGHRGRLSRAVASLRSEVTPVTKGWWGRPACLPAAKFDFLCVQAKLAAKRGSPGVNVDFMVDSGSDVCTVQESTVSALNLQVLGSVYSCGVHGGAHTHLYRAVLCIGGEELDIEVMGSNYDSLGSRVVRQFRHVIDAHSHTWLKGGYTDPLPAVMAPPATPALLGSLPPTEHEPDKQTHRHSDNSDDRENPKPPDTKLVLPPPPDDKSSPNPPSPLHVSLKRNQISSDDSLTKKQKLEESANLSSSLSQQVNPSEQLKQSSVNNNNSCSPNHSIQNPLDSHKTSQHSVSQQIFPPHHSKTKTNPDITKQQPDKPNLVPALLKDTDDDIDHMTIQISHDSEVNPGKTDDDIVHVDDVIHIALGNENDLGYKSQVQKDSNRITVSRPDGILTLTLDDLEDSSL